MDQDAAVRGAHSSWYWKSTKCRPASHDRLPHRHRLGRRFDVEHHFAVRPPIPHAQEVFLHGLALVGSHAAEIVEATTRWEMQQIVQIPLLPITADESLSRPSELRPFFGYYGGKWRDAAKHYAAPQHDVIVEPFAGSAGYALRYPERRVVLCEIDPVLAGIWSYLIRASASEILAIPDVPDGGSVADLGLCQEAAWLVGYWMNRGVTTPRPRPSKWMRAGIRPGSFWGDRVRRTIASQLHAIRHWEIHNVSYQECPVVGPATWFVDPPYQHAGRHYRFGSDQVDFARLSRWCRSRMGQVIVCENKGADWLPFKDLAHVKTTRRGQHSKEVVWTRTSKRINGGTKGS
jgi:hypothetical protein